MAPKILLGLKMKQPFFLLMLLTVPTIALNISSADEANERTYYRLPGNVVPAKYKLELKPILGLNKTFEGNVKITLQVLEKTNQITLHSNKLDLYNVSLRTVENTIVDIASTKTTNDTREFLYIKLLEEIPKGYYELQIAFSGDLNGIVGLYQSFTSDKRPIVASKFEPTYARQAFPCFDEPDFKATFDITLVKPPSFVALSNMNEISRTTNENDNTEVVSFATSVPMSTYLACFVICDFDYKEDKINVNGIGKDFILRSFAQKAHMHKINFAQNIGKRATEFYVKYYQVPFPLPKLDMIAIPDYFSGATENWGLITYRDTAFLLDEATASAANKMSVANTVAHELAHMWFGNLVTMKWWDDLWLNEGFASYMQVKSLNAIEPSWTMLDQFLMNTLHGVLDVDAQLSSHPIVQTVETPDQITAIFDRISYSKGASVIRMLEGFMGEENFRQGITDYLKKYAFKNTVTEDLLSSLEPYFIKEYPGLEIKYIMDTWTKQMGYPVLTVSQGRDPQTYVITQKRFLLDPNAVYANDSQFNYRWFIPITYTTSSGVNKNILWFPDTVNEVSVTLGENDQWIKINNNEIGYYRVNYQLEMWHKLIQQLQTKPEQLTISDRAHLLNDIFALANTRAVPYDLALDLTKYLVKEKDYVPWISAASIFSKLSDKLRHTDAYDDLKKYVQSLLRPLYEEQTWDKTDISLIKRRLRASILSLATRYGILDATDKVRELFYQWLNSYGTAESVTIEPDLRSFVYCYGMQSASQTDWDKLWGIFLNEQDEQEKAKLRAALAEPRDTNILRGYLTLAWEEKNIRRQNYFSVLREISDNPMGTELVWTFVREQWPRLVERFTLNDRYLGSMILGITSDFNTEEKYKQMEEFYAKYPDAGAGETPRRQALESVRNNIQWATEYQSSVAAWLTNKFKIN